MFIEASRVIKRREKKKNRMLPRFDSDTRGCGMVCVEVVVGVSVVKYEVKYEADTEGASEPCM